MNKALLSELIRRNRKSKGLTQAQFAELLNMSEMTIRRWESGERSPRMEELQKISSVLDVPINDLLDNSPTEPAKQTEQQPSLFKNTGYSLVYERNGERMELPPTAESYAIFRDIAARIANREVSPSMA